MKKLNFNKEINASAEKVYKIMLGIGNKATYQEWTAPFNPTSTYEGNWNKGSKIYFIASGEDGKKGGMVSEINENIPNKFVSIRHVGILDGEKEITSGPEVEKWAGILENYTFEERKGRTIVSVELDSDDEYVEYFNNTWELALNKLREISEK